MSNKEAKMGFTLIELLVVVLIIGILASVALPQYNKAVEKSRVSEAKAIMKAMSDAKKIYYMEQGAEPSKLDDLPLSFTDASGTVVTNGDSFSTKYFTYRMSYYHCSIDDSELLAVGADRIDMNYNLQYCPGKGFWCGKKEGGFSIGDCAKAGFSKQGEGISGAQWTE